MGSSEIRPAPTGWSPQTAMAMLFPAMAELRRAIQPEIRSIEARLDRAEVLGHDTACQRQALRVLRWRIEYTHDTDAYIATPQRERPIATRCVPAPLLTSDHEGRCSSSPHAA